MSTTIFKERLAYNRHAGETWTQSLWIPQGAEFLHVADQHFGEITVWFRCDPSLPGEERQFAVCSTGGAAPSAEEGEYIGTVVSANREVGHVFVRPRS